MACAFAILPKQVDVMHHVLIYHGNAKSVYYPKESIHPHTIALCCIQASYQVALFSARATVIISELRVA